MPRSKRADFFEALSDSLFHSTVRRMVPAASGERFRQEISHAYRERFGITPQIVECHPSHGAGEVKNLENSTSPAPLTS